MQGQNRVKLKNNGKVIIDDADTGWTWRSVSGFAGGYRLLDKNLKVLVDHYNKRVFAIKVLDFHDAQSGLYEKVQP